MLPLPSLTIKYGFLFKHLRTPFRRKKLDLKLPDIGEGIAEGEILKWLVKEGENVKEEQPLVEVMTDKVNVQIPSPWTGAVSKILAKEGETVKVGQVIIVIDSDPTTSRQLQSKRCRGHSRPGQSASLCKRNRNRAPPQWKACWRRPRHGSSPARWGSTSRRSEGSGSMGRITEEDIKNAATQGRGTGGQAAATAPPSVGRPNEERVPV